MMFEPLFAGGRLLCFAWCFIHSSDVGGLVPGSISPTAFDTFQEGTRSRPRSSSRQGSSTGAPRPDPRQLPDPRAELGRHEGAPRGAVDVGERRMDDVVAQYGEEASREAIPELLDYGETARAPDFEAIPDGGYDSGTTSRATCSRAPRADEGPGATFRAATSSSTSPGPTPSSGPRSTCRPTTSPTSGSSSASSTT